jgi:hypothetical protein
MLTQGSCGALRSWAEVMSPAVWPMGDGRTDGVAGALEVTSEVLWTVLLGWW